MNPLGDMLERHPDLSVDEGDISSILSHRVENHFLVSEIVVAFVGERWGSARVRLIRGESMAGFGSSD